MYVRTQIDKHLHTHYMHTHISRAQQLIKGQCLSTYCQTHVHLSAYNSPSRCRLCREGLLLQNQKLNKYFSILGQHRSHTMAENSSLTWDRTSELKVIRLKRGGYGAGTYYLHTQLYAYHAQRRKLVKETAIV